MRQAFGSDGFNIEDLSDLLKSHLRLRAIALLRIVCMVVWRSLAPTLTSMHGESGRRAFRHRLRVVQLVLHK